MCSHLNTQKGRAGRVWQRLPRTYKRIRSAAVRVQNVVSRLLKVVNGESANRRLPCRGGIGGVLMMRWIHMCRLGRMMAIATLGAAALVVASAGGPLPAAGYGPPGPPPPPVPGGYSVVVTSQTVIG